MTTRLGTLARAGRCDIRTRVPSRNRPPANVLSDTGSPPFGRLGRSAAPERDGGPAWERPSYSTWGTVTRPVPHAAVADGGDVAFCSFLGFVRTPEVSSCAHGVVLSPRLPSNDVSAFVMDRCTLGFFATESEPMTKTSIYATVCPVVLLSLVTGCKPDPGTEGAACFPNGTCNEGLVCLSDLCVSDEDPNATDGMMTTTSSSTGSSPPTSGSTLSTSSGASGTSETATTSDPGGEDTTTGDVAEGS